MKKITIIICIFSFLFSTSLFGQNENTQKTWTYTYLKAKKGQKENLRKFIEQNWFAMDSIAVSQGLFNDFQLLENAFEADTTWDFIVAVEYFTKGTYADIQEEWMEIKKNHETILIEGYHLQDLGGVVGSNIFSPISEEVTINCSGSQYESIEPFLGEWHEYLLTEEGEQIYGKLSISLDPYTCALTKTFSGMDNRIYYKTWGYFDSEKNVWVETYTFSRGYGIYQWTPIEDGFFLELQKGSSKPDYLNRNKWTNITESSFQIIEQRSYDDGQTWQVFSTTNMKRMGY